MYKYLEEGPNWEPNDDINNIQGLIDLIVDDFGNYYTPYRTRNEGYKLTEVMLCHALYDESFSTVFYSENIDEYKYSHLGELLLDRMNEHLKYLNLKNRKIFHVNDLIENGTKVSFYDITQYKTQNRGK
ncbi:hypothetical protein [Metabacillus sp. 22489]|uniref:hypothetical protein n=1 Tax=Metabacillus sp. 22489 TaxID=3453928 RepID=UPI003F859CA5